MKTDKRIDELLEACGMCGGEEVPPSIGMAQQSHDGNNSDGEARMAKSDLFNIAENAKMLHDMLPEDYPLEDWAEAKITKAADYIRSVHQYLKYELSQEGEPDQEGHTKIYIATDPRTLGL